MTHVDNEAPAPNLTITFSDAPDDCVSVDLGKPGASFFLELMYLTLGTEMGNCTAQMITDSGTTTDRDICHAALRTVYDRPGEREARGAAFDRFVMTVYGKIANYCSEVARGGSVNETELRRLIGVLQTMLVDGDVARDEISWRIRAHAPG